MLKTRPQPPELIPIPFLFGNPDKIQPLISPNGKIIAYLAPLEDVLNIWIRNVDEIKSFPITNDKKRGIQFYFWGYNNKFIYFAQDKNGDENWLLYSVNLETKNVICLTPYENVQVELIDRSKHYPYDLLIGMNKDNPETHDVYHLNLKSGEITLQERNDGNIIEWITDFDLNIRGIMRALPDGSFELLVRESIQEDWKKIYSWNTTDSSNSGPLIFTKEGKSILLLDSTDSNINKLIDLEIKTGKKNVIIHDPELKYDVSSIMIHPDTLKIQSVTFTKARDEYIILDNSIIEDINRIKTNHSGEFFLANRDEKDDNWLIGYITDNGPVPYYLYRKKSKDFIFLFDHQPELNNYQLAKMEPFSYLARDMLEIHGYISFPPNILNKNLPLLLIVHGGPWERDYWGFDNEVQMFTNRGYLCLQINFRGSTGYGKHFVNLGNKEWGRKMHTDLIDGVNWAVEKGYADPKRVAIYGGSYGGYAALVGATFTPDVFRCAVAIVAISNLITFIKTFPPYWKNFLADTYQRIGNPDTEQEFLKSRSPLFRVDQIKIPVMIVHGENDPRVKKSESDQIIEAMKKNGIEYEYLVYADEGHGLVIPENRIDFYYKMERFLAKHLGGRST